MKDQETQDIEYAAAGDDNVDIPNLGPELTAETSDRTFQPDDYSSRATSESKQSSSCSAVISSGDAVPKSSSAYMSKNAGGSVKMLPHKNPLKPVKRKSAQDFSRAPKKIAHKSHSKGLKNLPAKQKSSIKINSVHSKTSGPRKGGDALKNALMNRQRIRTDCTWVMCSNLECGKWRFLQVKDPSLIEDMWECKDNPDKRYGDCAAPEQWWDQGLKNKFVENRFTVGSLVWASMEGWPSWPAMVDDDPDTGDFFWTGVKEGEWEQKPSFYHVVFFDAKDKNVSRAWVPDRKVKRMVVGDKANISKNKRLVGALEMARQAGREDLDTRRKKYCLASRFKGPWGSVWPDFDEDSDLDNEEVLCRDMMKEAEIGISNNMSLNHDESISALMHIIPTRNEEVDDVRGNKSNNIEEDSSVLEAPKSLLVDSVSPSIATDAFPSLENVPPLMSFAQLYDDKLRQTADIGALQDEYLSSCPSSSPYHSLLDPSDRDSELLLYSPSFRTSKRSIFAPLTTSESLNFVGKLTFIPKLSSTTNDPFVVSEGGLNLTLNCSSCQKKTDYSTKLGFDEAEFKCDSCLIEDPDCEIEGCENCKRIAAELDARWIHRKNVEGVLGSSKISNLSS